MLAAAGQRAASQLVAAALPTADAAAAAAFQLRRLSSGTPPRQSLAAVEKLFRQMEGRWVHWVVWVALFKQHYFPGTAALAACRLASAGG